MTAQRLAPAFRKTLLRPVLHRPLSSKPEMHDVAIRDGIVLSFQAHLAGIARAALAAERHIVIVGDGLGADEPALEVGMNHGCGLRRLSAAGDGPGRRLLRAGGE